MGAAADLARALLGVELAHGHELDPERLALLQLDRDLLAQLHRLDVRARGQLAHVAVALLVRGRVTVRVKVRVKG